MGKKYKYTNLMHSNKVLKCSNMLFKSGQPFFSGRITRVGFPVNELFFYLDHSGLLQGLKVTGQITVCDLERFFKTIVILGFVNG